MENKKLYLIDAMALIYRSYYALNKNPRVNSKGLNTSAILGFANTLYDLMKSQKPTHIGVAFDGRKPTFRHEKFEAYKAHRDAMPEDIIASIPYIQLFLQGMNIPILLCEGYEADDIIGSLAKKAEKKEFKVYMVTPDKDFGQLISENIFMYRLGRMGNRDEIWGVDQILDYFSIQKPEQVADILGLWGDSSDNIPGVPGIGEKKAKALIAQFGSIEEMLENTSQIENEKLRNVIVENAEKALFSKELATIHLDTPVDFDEELLKTKKPNEQELKVLFEELEFRNFAKRFFTGLSLTDQIEIPSPIASGQQSLFSSHIQENENTLFSSVYKNIQTGSYSYKIIADRGEREKLISEIQKSQLFSFYLLKQENAARIYGISLSVNKDEACFIPLFDDAEVILKDFAPIFESENILKIGYDLKREKELLALNNISIKGLQFDNLIAHYLLNSESRHNIEMLSETYLGYSLIDIESLVGKVSKKQSIIWDTVDPEKLKDYCCEYANINFQLHAIFEKLLEQEELLNLFTSVEIPLIDVLLSMQQNGVNIDVEYLKRYSSQLQEERKKIEEQIYELAGIRFNIASPKQLGDVLFGHMKIVEKSKQTASKQFSTAEEVLTKLADKHPIIKKILEYRALSKLINTYLDTFPLLISLQTGRIHTSFNQTVTATGRLSSTSPNLQNIPIRTERGREIRKAFIPRDKEYVLLSADYSQIELRIIAELSNDKQMLDAFQKGVDIHASTASKIYKIPINELDSQMRRNAKSVNFGIIYGISAFGLSEQLGISRKEANDLIEEYFIQYPDIKKYIESNIAFARKYGYVKTILGRRRKLNDINSRNNNLRGFAERNAVNMPVQGSAADMIKTAMVAIYDEFQKAGLKSRMVLQVHDELVFDVYKPELEIVQEIVNKEMASALELKVPIVVDMGYGNNWLEAH